MFPIPREPMWFVSCYTGRHTPANPYGLVPQWNDDDACEAWLFNRLIEGFNNGAEFCFLNRAMGGDGLSHVTAASWHTLKPAQQNALGRVQLSAGHATPALVPFFGSMLRGKDQITGWRADIEREVELLLAPGPLFRDSLETMAGWDSIGVKHFFIDNGAAGHKTTHFVGVADRLAKQGVMLGIEAIPLTAVGRVNEHLILRVPCLATDTFVQGNGSLATSVFDPETTRMYVWLNGPAWHYGTPDQRRALALDYCRRGWILVTNDLVMFAAAKQFGKGAA